MNRRIWKRMFKSGIALILAIILTFQGTEPLVAYAKEAVENLPRQVDFSRPEALESVEEAGVNESEITSETSEGSQEESTGATDETNEVAAPEEEPKTTEEEANLNKEPQDYYPLPEEPKGELVSYDEKSRTYKTGAKEFTTVIGGYVGTYKDEDGTLQLVDNTLEKKESEQKQTTFRMLRSMFAEEETGVYENKSNDYSIRLPEHITQDAGIVIEKDDSAIEIVPMEGDYTHPVAKGNAILYNQVYDGVDVQYTVLDADIKEDIVLNKKVSKNSFSYELRIPGLKAELQDNQVYLYPEDKTIKEAKYILEAPSMEDAAGEVSFLITLGLEQLEDKIILTVTPDAGWLNDETRQYPVRIDPSTVNIEKEAFSLIGVEEGSPNTTVGDNNYPYVGFDDGIKSGNLRGFGKAHQNCRTYIKVNDGFGAIPKDSKIDSAVFSVSQKTAYSGGASQFGLYRVDQDWATNITWKTKPLAMTFVDVQNSSISKDTYINYNVKDLVNDWVQGTYPNYGMALVSIAETNNAGTSMQCEVLNNRNSTYGPRISVVWSPAEDPYLRDMSIDDTTVCLRPMTEKNLNGKLRFDAVFADGIAKSKSLVEYYLTPDEYAETDHHVTDAKPLYSYPDSTEYNQAYPEANKYYSKDSNWQSVLYTGLMKDKLYSIKAKATKEIDGTVQTGREATSDSFVIYEVKQFDTFPKIASYYGVPLASIMKDNQVQDALVVANNTIFIRNPQTNVPYSPAPLTDYDKMQIDGALMGRGLHCEFGFEPINLNTGNFYMDETDASMQELNGEFAITRSYNSKGTDQNSVFGRGWSFNYSQSLSQMEDGRILYLRGDGSFLFFTKGGDGSYSAPAGYHYGLKQVSYENTDHDEIGWELTDEANNVWSFDKYGMLRFVTDEKGFVTKVVYDDDYHLTGIISASGKVFHIAQNASGYITGITLPDGTKLSYEYDDKGNLIAAWDGNGKKRTYAYDNKGRMVSWKDENGNTVVKNTYDDAGRVIKQTDASGATSTLSYANGSTTTTDNEGHQTIYQYDDMYRTTAIIYPDKTKVTKAYNDKNQLVKETSARGSKTYTYDGFGNIATETREDGAKASYVYDANNRLVSVTGFAGDKVSYAYDAAGNMTQCIMPDGSRSTYSYDALHRMVAQVDGRGIRTTYAYDGPNLVSYTDGEGCVWSFGYDKMNRQISMTDPLGNTSTQSYDKKGNITSKTAADGGRITYQLDGVGNILSTSDARGNVTSFAYDKMYNITKTTDPLGNASTYSYNKNGEQIEQTNATGDTITYTRDVMGRVVQETNKDFGTKKYVYDAAGNLVSYVDGEGATTKAEFNKQGLATKVTDALGNETRYTYDAMGRQTSITYADGSSTKTVYDACGRVLRETDEMGATIRYTYDASGNVISIKDDSGRTYTYGYDRNNRRIKEINPEGGECSYTYDKGGRLTSYTDELGRTEKYAYDKAGRITTVTDAMGHTIKSSYDKDGNLISSVDGEGNTTTMTYDGIGNLTSVTDAMGNITAMGYDANGKLAQTIDALKNRTSYSYDAMGNVTKVTDARGNAYISTYDKNGQNTKVEGPKKATTYMVYDAMGQLLSVKDAQGLRKTYTYDKRGRVTKEKDNAGNETAYTYDAAGNVTSKTDALGRKTTYTYDKYGRLLRIEEPGESITSYTYDVMDRITSVTDAEGVCTTFAYDKAGNQIGMTEEDKAVYQYAFDKKNRLITETNPLGGSKNYTYDANDKVTSVTDENGITTKYQYDKNGNMVAATDGNGNTTTYGYDELNRLIQETSASEEVKEYRYDSLGNLSKYKDAMGLITEYKYDAYGNMIEEISPKGASTKYTYDMHQNVIAKVDPLGNVTTYEVNLNDQITKMVQPNEGSYTYAYDAIGRVEKITTPLGFSTSFSYDKAGNVIKESNSLQQVTSYTYDKMHRMISSTDAAGNETSFAYDLRGNLIGEKDALGRENTYTYDALSRVIEAKNPLGQVTSYTYDPVGNLTKSLKPGGRETSYAYDGNYNVTGVTDPLGNVTAYAYDKSNRLTGITDALKQTQSYGYDKNGRLSKETDAAGNETAYDYDAHGNVITYTDKTGLNTHFAYDDNDNLIRVTDAAGGQTSYTYDAMNWLTGVVSADGKETTYTYDLEGNMTSRKDAKGRKEVRSYDEAGRLTSVVSPSGKKINYDYDELNQLVQKSYENAKGKKTEEDVLYGYDATGQRVSMKDAIGNATYEYDELGRIVKAVDSAGKEVGYRYNENGSVEQILYPDGTKVSYAYDLNDNLTKVTDREGDETTYTYDALNRVVKTSRGNGLETDVTYDEIGNITALTTFCTGCGEVVSRYEYTYNSQGYVTEEKAEESKAGLNAHHGTQCRKHHGKYHKWHPHHHEHDGKCTCVTTTRKSYEYDENWQLTKCTEKTDNKARITHTYAYDADGNRTHYTKQRKGHTLESIRYKYNDANQLIARKDELAKKNKTTFYRYDEDGNLIAEYNWNHKFIRVYDYTPENHLRAVTSCDEVLMAALYDGDGNKLFQMDYEKAGLKRGLLIPPCKKGSKLSKELNELADMLPRIQGEHYAITEYVNDINRENAEVLMELKVDGRKSAAYTYGVDRLRRDEKYDSAYYLYDGRGSVSGLSNTDGKVTDVYRYDAFGNLSYGVPLTTNYYGYNGESTNTNTGLQYLRARYYNPENGNFTTEDTYAGSLAQPLTQNRYTYVSNNPLAYTDPTGHSLLSRIGGGIKNAVSTVVNAGKRLFNSAVNTAKQGAQWAANTFSKGAQQLETKTKKAVQTFNRGYQKAKESYTTHLTYQEQANAAIRKEISRELCASTKTVSDFFGNLDWKEVGITFLALTTATIVAIGATPTLLGLLPEMGAWGTVAAEGAISGGLGGVGYSFTESCFHGKSVEETIMDVTENAMSGAVVGLGVSTVGYGGHQVISKVSPTVKPLIDKVFKNTTENADDVAKGAIDAAKGTVGEGGINSVDDLFTAGKKAFDNFDINNAYVKPKHLSTTGGNGQKFIGSSKAEAESILKDALSNGKIVSISDNGLTKAGNASYEIIIDAGKTVGTKGENLVKIIISSDGGMLSAYPIK